MAACSRYVLVIVVVLMVPQFRDVAAVVITVMMSVIGVTLVLTIVRIMPSVAVTVV